MQYRKMGASDLEVSAIGFGCWEMGGTQYGEVDDAEEIAAVHRAIDLGVTLFDTAAIYGQGYSEVVLGRALGARRKEVVLVTKGGLVWDGRTSGSSRRDSSYWALTQGLEASLHRLGTDYVDLFLIHWPDVNTPMDEAARGLQAILDSGKARYVGVSNFSAAQLRAIRQHVPVCANQVGYNLFDRRWEREMFPTARELGVGVMAYGPMAHGLLTGAFTRDTKFVDWDWRSRGTAFGQALFTPENFPRNVEVADRLKEVAPDRHDASEAGDRLGAVEPGRRGRALRNAPRERDRAQRRGDRRGATAGDAAGHRRADEGRGRPGRGDPDLTRSPNVASSWTRPPGPRASPPRPLAEPRGGPGPARPRLPGHQPRRLRRDLRRHYLGRDPNGVLKNACFAAGPRSVEYSLLRLQRPTERPVSRALRSARTCSSAC